MNCGGGGQADRSRQAGGSSWSGSPLTSRCDTEQSCSEAVIFSLSKSELQDAVEGSRARRD